MHLVATHHSSVPASRPSLPLFQASKQDDHADNPKQNTRAPLSHAKSKKQAQPKASISKPEMRMIIPQIIRIRAVQPPIPLASVTLLILHHDTQQQHHARRRTHPQQTQTRAIADSVMRRLRRDEDITRDDPATVAEPDHHSARNRALVVARHVILDPSEGDRLADVAAADDDEDGEVAHAHCHGVLAEQDNIPDGRNANPQNAEPEAMACAVCAPGHHQRNNSRDDKHGNAAHLSRLRSVSEIADDSGREEAC